MGETDSFLPRSQALASNWYAESSCRVETHSGGHHIPPLSSGLYAVMNEWLSEAIVRAESGRRGTEAGKEEKVVNDIEAEVPGLDRNPGRCVVG